MIEFNNYTSMVAKAFIWITMHPNARDNAKTLYSHAWDIFEYWNDQEEKFIDTILEYYICYLLRKELKERNATEDEEWEFDQTYKEKIKYIIIKTKEKGI